MTQSRYAALRDRLMRVRRDPRSTGDEAERVLRKVGAQADRIFAPGPGTDDQAKDERLAWLRFRMRRAVMAVQYPERLPAPVHLIGGGEATVEPGGGIVTSYPPERWRERLEDDAAVLGLMADLDLPPLTGTPKAAADYITAHPGALGKTIAERIDTSRGNFQRIFHDKLQPRGFFNAGDGYLPPSV